MVSGVDCTLQIRSIANIKGEAVSYTHLDVYKRQNSDRYPEDERNNTMKLLSIAIPCYNSQDYMAHCIEDVYKRQPNKSWEGCNVNDPSARVLANYGDSGK